MRGLALGLIALAAGATALAETLVVGNKNEHTVSFIDLAGGEEVARRETGRSPHEIAVSPDGALAVVVSYRTQNYEGNTLHLFDVATARKVGEISLGAHKGPHGLKWIPGGDRAIVTTEITKDVVVVDIGERALVGAVATDQDGSHMVALSPDAKRAFVSNIGSGSFTVVDLETLEKVADVKAGEGTEAIAVTPDGKEIWVGNNGSRSVMIFDAATLEKRAEFETDGVPIRVEISPDGAMAAVSEPDLDRVSIYDAATRARVAAIDLAAVDARIPVTMLFSPDGARLWVAATGSAKIVEIATDGWSIVRTLPAGRGSDGLGYSPVSTQTE
ncbi:YncE family protein [Amphiplicatus metriothermophilus]|uniref:DNA-binding beta-propeller fold protein YncE n=1 Tax=Amphiplicatus metriothermophilus TaxID=1519374 RepID=A0A239PZW7_9PROT|nr:YncE family protein [Amphiplicatus metriothermophilus]MBB5520045.1 DNA-binding beta-propeller fold protein YncE [Amphiplicatus metriothermophilus]SNT75814.1 DNA-binding beta-propeller fold protein YncE [Amphiplicatus metriothermophilus]